MIPGSHIKKQDLVAQWEAAEVERRRRRRWEEEGAAAAAVAT